MTCSQLTAYPCLALPAGRKAGLLLPGSLVAGHAAGHAAGHTAGHAAGHPGQLEGGSLHTFIFGPNLKTKTLLRPRSKLNNKCFSVYY